MTPLPPTIRELSLRGFRSIAEERVRFDNPTFLVGRNGSGKTNLVNAISFLAETMTSPLASVMTRRGGITSVLHRSVGVEKKTLKLEAQVGRVDDTVQSGRYSFEVRALPDRAFEVLCEQCSVTGPDGKERGFSHLREKGAPPFTSSLPGLRPDFRPLFEPTSLLLPVIGGHESLAPLVRTLSSMRVYAIQPATLRGLQEPDGGVELQWDGSNTASVLQELSRRSPRALERISELLATVLPHEVHVKPVQYGNRLTVQFTQEWGSGQQLVFDASSMSDGTLRALGILAAVFQEPAPSLMVIEEPEATIHPGALGLILDVLQLASERTQVVVTTHSPELLDAKWIEDRHLRIVAWEDGETYVAPIAEGARRALQEHLMGAGELLRSNALDSPPLRRSKA